MEEWDGTFLFFKAETVLGAKGEGESCFFALLSFLFYEHFTLLLICFYCGLSGMSA